MPGPGTGPSPEGCGNQGLLPVATVISIAVPGGTAGAMFERAMNRASGDDHLGFKETGFHDLTSPCWPGVALLPIGSASRL